MADGPSPSSQSVPLDAMLRQRPIHPDLPQVKVPASDLETSQYHPITCEPFTAEELRQHNLPGLQEQYKTPAAAAKAQEETVRELKQRLEEHERKTKEIEREMADKEKMRGIERKVFEKQGKGVTKQ